jgi:hypothetical protein
MCGEEELFSSGIAGTRSYFGSCDLKLLFKVGNVEVFVAISLCLAKPCEEFRCGENNAKAVR